MQKTNSEIARLEGKKKPAEIGNIREQTKIQLNLLATEIARDIMASYKANKEGTEIVKGKSIFVKEFLTSLEKKIHAKVKKDFGVIALGFELNAMTHDQVAASKARMEEIKKQTEAIKQNQGEVVANGDEQQ